MIRSHRLVSSLRSGVFAALVLLPWAFTTRAALAQSVVEIPGAGRVSDVAQTAFRDGFAQRVTFAGGPRNYAEISVRNGADAGGRFGSALIMAKPTRLGIAAELLARFPGEGMRVSTVPKRNAYGPVGLAVGSNCLYAWQWIDLAPRSGGRSAPDSLFGGSTERAASLRVSLCRTATATLADLVSGVERMNLSLGAGREGGRPHVSTRAAPKPRREAPSARASKEPAKAAAQPPGAMERPSARNQKADDGRRAPVPVVERASPTIPSPPAAGTAVPLPAGPATGAPRYITDPTPTLAPTAPVAAPKPAAPTSVETEDRLSPDLPIRAYRPPP
ncbi:cellulose biosynthesis protein BcsN [Methylobacterium sp. CM6241]